MENVLLIVLLLLALALIGVVLLQRSEGGGLGMGSGGGGGGVMTGRSAASALSKVTWILGVAFMTVALLMTVLTSLDGNGSSVVDQLAPPSAETAPVAPAGADLLPPSADEPATPRAD
ncbi:preprotein translocase subunit SecG [Nereida sp.]|uniref:preprotein translocase subunit SecG n=1 Tax=Nereida sp. TaxID=2736090 RepID=UPI003F6A1C28